MYTNAFYACPSNERNSGGPYVSGRAHRSGESLHGSGRAAHLHLTPRQREVLRLLCEGLPNKLICRHLNISAGTVKAHISSILRELGVTSRLQAVVAAKRLGLFDEHRPLPRSDAPGGTGEAPKAESSVRTVARTGTR